MRNWAYMRIADKLMTQEYAMARVLGYSAVEASLHVMRVQDDFRGMCEAMRVERGER